MKWKNINREEKIVTVAEYIDESKKITTDYKAFFDKTEIPEVVYKKIEYIDPDGNIDEDKSIYLRGSLPYDFNNDKTSQKEHTESDSDSDTESESESDSDSDSDI